MMVQVVVCAILLLCFGVSRLLVTLLCSRWFTDKWDRLWFVLPGCLTTTAGISLFTAYGAYLLPGAP